MPKKPTSDEVWLALDQLRRALNDAYWEISDPQQGDRILALAQDVDSIQDDMDKDAIISNTAAYKNLQARVKGVNDKLDQLKKDIDGMIHSVETVTKIAGYIDQAMQLAAKYFV